MAEPHNPVQRRSLDTKESILKAAKEMIEKHGVKRFTTADVAEQSGNSIGTLYRYFPDKWALLEAVYPEHTITLGRSYSDPELPDATASGESLATGEQET